MIWIIQIEVRSWINHSRHGFDHPRNDHNMPYASWVQYQHILINIRLLYAMTYKQPIIHLFVSDKVWGSRFSAARFLSIRKTDFAISPAAFKAIVLTNNGSKIPLFHISTGSPPSISMPKPRGDALAAITFSKPLYPAFERICLIIHSRADA